MAKFRTGPKFAVNIQLHNLLHFTHKTSRSSLKNLTGLDEISSGQTPRNGAKNRAGLRNVGAEARKSATEVEKSGQVTGARTGQSSAHKGGTTKNKYYYVEIDEKRRRKQPKNDVIFDDVENYKKATTKAMKERCR